jgi:hypothetical protein
MGIMSAQRQPPQLPGTQRRAVDASVAACGAAIAALAFRNSLWWIIGSSATLAGPEQLATLVGAAILCAFLMLFMLETLLRSHSRPAR